MARVLGDTLIVNRAHKPGEEHIINLMELFNQNPNRIIAVAGTVGADGTPNTAPVTLIYAKNPKTMLVATLRNTTTANSMRLIKEPMAFSDAMALWEMQVEKVKLDTSPAQRVFQGPASTPRNEKAEAFEKAGVAELVTEAQKG
jgi:hypothetical protein